jgi:hypothetical protein
MVVGARGGYLLVFFFGDGGCSSWEAMGKMKSGVKMGVSLQEIEGTGTSGPRPY